MPRTQRWQEVKHGFQSGVLSPAVQDQVDGPAWLAGAADIVNFEVMRDGGLSGRPPFVRSPHAFTAPQWSAIATDGINRDGADGHLLLRAGQPVLAYDGIFALKRSAAVPHVLNVVDTTKALYEVAIDAPMGVKAITWHGARILTNSPWSSTNADGNRRLNFTCEWSDDDGATWSTTDADPVAMQNEDELGWGAFVPGRVARDIVVPLVDRTATAPRMVNRVRVRLKYASQQAPVQLGVQGVSCYTEVPPMDAIGRYVFYEREPYRIVSWVAGNVPLVAVMTLEGVQAFHIDGRDVRTVQGAIPSATWYFTPRQIRELSLETYGKSLLLFHRDFPYPVRIQLGQDTQLAMDYLRLENIPVVDIDKIPDATVSVSQIIEVQNPEEVG